MTTAALTRRRWAPSWPALEPYPLEPGLAKRDEQLVGRLQDAAELHLAKLTIGGGRLDKRVIRGGLGAYNEFRKRAHASGQAHGHMTTLDFAKAVYPDVETPADADRKVSSLNFVRRRLAAAGALHTEEVAGQGIYWRLIDEPVRPELWPDSYPGSASPCSSTGRAADS